MGYYYYYYYYRLYRGYFDIYLFIYCNLVSTMWQWSVNLYKKLGKRQLYTKGERIQKHRIQIWKTKKT